MKNLWRKNYQERFARFDRVYFDLTPKPSPPKSSGSATKERGVCVTSGFRPQFSLIQKLKLAKSSLGRKSQNAVYISIHVGCFWGRRRGTGNDFVKTHFFLLPSLCQWGVTC